MPNGGSILVGASVAGASLIAINGTAAAQRIVLGTSGTDAVINATRTSGTSPNLLFQLESAEQMRLTSTGLGIGTSSPTTKLHTSAYAAISTTIDRVGDYGPSIQLVRNGVAGNAAFGLADQNQLGIYLNDIEQGRWTTTGLGIGTSSPAYKLDVVGEIRAKLDNEVLRLDSALSTSPVYQRFTNGGGNSYIGLNNSTGGGLLSGSAYELCILTESARAILFGTSNATRMTLDASGNLGLGVTPSANNGVRTLIVADQGGTLNALTLGAKTGGYGEIGYGFGFNGAAYKYLTSDFASKISFNAGGVQFYNAPSGTAGNAITFTQALTLDASGNLGVGTTSPASYNAGGNSLVVGGSGNYKGMTIASAIEGSIYFADGTSGTETYRGVVSYNHTSDFMAFYTAANERARITSGGDFLVGATSAYVSTFSGITAEGKTSGVGNNLALGLFKAGTPQILDGDVLGNIYFYGADNDVTPGNNNIGARIASIATSNWTTDGTTSNAALAFYTHGTTSGAPEERARITSDGNLLVGTTSAIQASRFGVLAGSSTNCIAAQNTNDSNYLYTGTNSSNTEVFRVAGSGNVLNTNNSYGALSDSKLKENITDATSKLEKLNQVRVVNFNMIGSEHKQIGVIAQELEQVFPGMVDETPDRDQEGNDLGTTTKSVKYSVFVPMLIKAMQELKAEFDAYKASHP